MDDLHRGSEARWPTAHILGVQVHEIDYAGMLAQINAWAQEQDTVDEQAGTEAVPCRQICTVNPEFIVDARRDPHFSEVLQAADLRVPDGIGVLWAAGLLGSPLRERITGSDSIYHICRRASMRGWRVFLLGAAPGVAEETAVRLRTRYPGLVVCGAYSGSPSQKAWPAIYRYLLATRPHILFVAYGHPRQDHWINEHLDELPAAVAMGVGGAFDFVAEITQRAPAWMQRAGIEWLHRLLHEPWRWRRMLKLPLFAGLVIREWWLGLEDS